MKISIILPVYNPIEGWTDIVLAETVRLRLMMSADDLEFIMVNDGSTNQAYLHESPIIEKSDIQLIEYPSNKGKGEAIRTGVKASTGELVIYTDIDFPYAAESIIKLSESLKTGSNDVIAGVKDKAYYDHVPRFRKFVSKLLRLFVRIFFRILTDDFMCGLKGFNQKGKDVFLQTTIDRYLFDLDFMFLLSRRSDIKTATLEVKLKDNVQFRKMNPRIIGSELRDLFKILMGTYKRK